MTQSLQSLQRTTASFGSAPMLCMVRPWRCLVRGCEGVEEEEEEEEHEQEEEQQEEREYSRASPASPASLASLADAPGRNSQKSALVRIWPTRDTREDFSECVPLAPLADAPRPRPQPLTKTDCWIVTV